MGGYNKAIICGNLGADAETRYTSGGTAVSTISIATSETWTDKNSGERKEDVQWHRVVIWGQTAESLGPYLLKGKSILVEGKIQTKKWTDRDGGDRYTTEVRADRVVLLGGGRNEDTAQKPAPAAAQPVELTEDQIPF